MQADLDCEFASEDTERSESTDALNQSRPKSVGNSGQANLRGYLWRLGGEGSVFSKTQWKKRWCVLTNGEFTYFKSRDEWSRICNDDVTSQQRLPKTPFKLIDCDVVPAEGEEGDPPDEELEEFFATAAEEDASVQNASNAATDSHVAPPMSNHSTPPKNLAQLMMRRQSGGGSGTYSINSGFSFGYNSPIMFGSPGTPTPDGSPSSPLRTPTGSPRGTPKRHKRLKLPKNTFGFVIVPRDPKKVEHRLRAPDREQRSVWMERLILAINRNSAAAAQASAEASGSLAAGDGGDATGREKPKPTQRRRTQVRELASAARKAAATLPEWQYAADRHNVAALLWRASRVVEWPTKTVDTPADNTPAPKSSTAQHTRSTSDTICFIPDLQVDTTLTRTTPQSPRRKRSASNDEASPSRTQLSPAKSNGKPVATPPSLRKLRALKERLRPSSATTIKAKSLKTHTESKQLFKQLDKNGDGVLDREEFESVVKLLKAGIAPPTSGPGASAKASTAESKEEDGAGEGQSTDEHSADHDKQAPALAEQTVQREVNDPLHQAMASEDVRARIAQMVLPRGVRHQLWGCAKLQRATQGMHWIYKWPGQDGRLPPPRKGPRPSLFAGDEDAEAESPDKAVPADAQVPRSETEQEVVVVAKLPHPAGWYGVLEADEYGRIVALDLSRNRLKGTLPYDGLGRLVELRVLRMRGNDLLGRIPRDLGALTKLTHLDLSRNQLAGYIPGPPLKKLQLLEILDLSYNKLTGQVPVVELAELRNLSVIQLQGNNLADVDEAKSLLEVSLMHISGFKVRV